MQAVCFLWPHQQELCKRLETRSSPAPWGAAWESTKKRVYHILFTLLSQHTTADELSRDRRRAGL